MSSRQPAKNVPPVLPQHHPTGGARRLSIRARPSSSSATADGTPTKKRAPRTGPRSWTDSSKMTDPAGARMSLPRARTASLASGFVRVERILFARDGRPAGCRSVTTGRMAHRSAAATVPLFGMQRPADGLQRPRRWPGAVARLFRKRRCMLGQVSERRIVALFAGQW